MEPRIPHHILDVNILPSICYLWKKQLIFWRKLGIRPGTRLSDHRITRSKRETQNRDDSRERRTTCNFPYFVTVVVKTGSEVAQASLKLTKEPENLELLTPGPDASPSQVLWTGAPPCLVCAAPGLGLRASRTPGKHSIVPTATIATFKCLRETVSPDFPGTLWRLEFKMLCCTGDFAKLVSSSCSYHTY